MGMDPRRGYSDDIERLLDALAGLIVREEAPLRRVRRDLESKTLLAALRRSKSRCEAGKKIGLDRQLIYQWIRRFGFYDPVLDKRGAKRG